MKKKKYTSMLFEIFALDFILMLFVLIETEKQNCTDWIRIEKGSNYR